jgi:hypothetical protein
MVELSGRFLLLLLFGHVDGGGVTVKVSHDPLYPVYGSRAIFFSPITAVI